MKAARRDRYGSPDVVEIRDVPTPTPTEDRVLVRVIAASVNRADLDQLYPRWQFYRLVAGIRRPRSPNLGLDVAGVVEAVGPGATRLKVGDRVYADLFSFGMGSFAEHACATERAFRRIPDGMSFEDAATLPHSAILALQSLRSGRGRRVQAGQRLLIDGASGNVGPFAIQIGKSLGVEVTATARAEKLEFVRTLGADHALDYRAIDYTRAGERYDWIVDTDAHHSVWDARRALVPGGLYQTLGGGTADMFGLLFVAPVASRGGRSMGLMLGWRPFQNAQDDAATLEALYAAGTLRPFIDRRFPLEATADALRYLESGASRGKVLIVP